jgi:hypothetical protein
LTNIGYIRGYEGHVDGSTSFLIQSNDSTQATCRSNQQAPQYTARYPMLTVEAGAALLANYSENGHVTKDSLPPDNLPHPGTYSWFLAPSGADLSTLGRLYANARLLQTGSFDDGLCAEDATKGRDGPRQCQSQWVMPASLASGTYQLVWLWHFPKVERVLEMYSSCADVEIVQMPVSTQKTRTSTIFITTRILTTLEPRVSDMSVTTSSLVPSSSMTSSIMATKTTTLSSMPTLPVKALLVSTMIEEVQQNPLVDANNVLYITTLVTMAITTTTPHPTTSSQIALTTAPVAVVMLVETAYITVTAAS